MTSEADIATLRNTLVAEISDANTPNDLENIRIYALGKKGRVSLLMRTLGQMTPQERQIIGPALNILKKDIADYIAEKKTGMDEAALLERLSAERVDISLDPAPRPRGSIHPVSQVMDEIAEIFARMGFDIKEGPHIETDFYNFTALNIPDHHPAREMQDTFYLQPDAEGHRKVLRTHTSPVQIRTLLKEKPPVRIIAPGRTFRSDSDATHTPMFHQVEGLVIDKKTHLGHLKGTLELFLSTFFEVDTVKLRLRPSYFPFTEPSMEVDIQCSFAGGKLSIGEGEDWLEILGSGMVHSNVLKACHLDPEIYQGFAFGVGIDRLAMLKYGMNDLRAFFDSDLRWLRHYGFKALDLPTLAGGLSS